jgi:uncharacterized membrane protein
MRISLPFVRNILAFFSLAIAMFALSYFFVESTGFLSLKSTELRNSAAWLTPFYLHLSFGALALGTGIFQFYKRFRDKHRMFHRFLGRIYFISVLISSLTAFIIIVNATGGWITQTGFSLMAIFWLYTGIMAFLKIKGGDVQQHEAWIMRNFALTFGAVTLRVWLPFFDFIVGLSFIESYRIAAWMAWVPNLIFIEWYIRNRLPHRIYKGILTSE